MRNPKFEIRNSPRVLVVSHNYPAIGDSVYGAFIHEQVRGLRSLGVDCFVLQPDPAPPFPWFLLRPEWRALARKRRGFRVEVDGIPVRHPATFHPIPNRIWRTDQATDEGRSLVHYLRSQHPHLCFDVILAHFLWPGAAAALFIKDAFKRPLVAVARGDDVHEWPSRSCRTKEWVARVIRESDRIVANCQALEEDALQIESQTKSQIEVIYNGSDTRRFAPVRPDEKSRIKHGLGFRSQEKLLLFVGSLYRNKGINELLGAFRTFAAAHTDWRLILVGKEIRDFSLSNAVASLGLERYVRHFGLVPREQVHRFYQAADAFCLPSENEGISNALMEAMATGLPVITTQVGGHAELIEDRRNGMFVSTHSPRSILDALEQIEGIPGRAAQMGREARKTVLERFPQQRSWRKLKRILEDVVVRRQR